jgi:dolichol kinase
MNEAIKAAVLFISAYLLGLWVIKRNIRVNYTRKILHFILFFFPLLLASYLPFRGSLATVLASGIVFVLSILILSEPLRKHAVFLQIVFASFDRPEDRPYTLLWLTTQVLATYAVLLGVLIWLQSYEKQTLIYITVLVAGVGDGLAEPIGVRFGRHKYRVRALFTNRSYTRSLEGSACVLVSGILAVLLLQAQLSAPEFVLAMLAIPPVMTLAEALSPHTWDGPFLYLAGGASTVGVLELSRLI